MIVAETLTRKYGDFVAVDRASFEIERGEVVGLLGHNGAGKTTIMKMLTGYLEPTGGRVLIDGADLEDVRAEAQATMGYLPENCPVYPEMTVIEYLDFAAELRQTPDARRDAAIREAIAATDLFEKAAEPIGALSRGLRQRVGVAQAILNDPKIVILDEPTNGLDPSQIHHMRALIRSLAERATVILSTHILQEVEAVCDRVIIVNRGRIALDTPLSALGRGSSLRLSTSLEQDAVAAIAAQVGLENPRKITGEAGRTTVELPLGDQDPSAAAAAVAQTVIAQGGALFALHPADRDLDAVFAEISSGQAETSGEAEETAHV